MNLGSQIQKGIFNLKTYRNKQLASKDMEMETYKKTAEEKMFQLEAKVKELEAKAVT